MSKQKEQTVKISPDQAAKLASLTRSSGTSLPAGKAPLKPATEIPVDAATAKYLSRSERVKRLREAEAREQQMPEGQSLVPSQTTTVPAGAWRGEEGGAKITFARQDEKLKSDVTRALQAMHECGPELGIQSVPQAAQIPSVPTSTPVVESASAPVQAMMLYEGGRRQVQIGDVFEDHAGCLSKVYQFESGGWVVVETPGMGYMKVTDEYMEKCALVSRNPV